MEKDFNIDKPGYKTPDNYFEGIEDAVFNKLKSKQLDTIEDTGFITPDNYFNSVESKVLNKLDKEPKVISILSRKQLIYASMVAAAAILVFSIFLKSPESSIEDLDTELVENYIIEQDLSTFEIASLLTDEQLQDLEVNALDDVFTDESLESYLLDNVDLETIIEQ